MRFELFLAKRYMASHKGRGLSVITWIALAGVTVGVASLITVLSVMSGFERDLREKILGNNAHILVTMTDASSKAPQELYHDVDRIEKIPSIDSAMPVVYGEAFVLSGRGGAEGAFIKGINPDQARKVLKLDAFLAEGSWDKFKGRAAILGSQLADSLALDIGDSFTIVLSEGEFSPLGITPRMQRLELVDTFHSGMSQFDAHHIYLPIDSASELFQTKPQSIEVKTKDPRKIPQAKEEIRKVLGPASRVTDWISQNQDLLSALQLEKLVMGLILGLIVLVAAFNICGSLIMVVKDKTRDIAILKSMGALDSSILKIFFAQGLFIGVVGTVVGGALGVCASIVLRDYVRFPLNRAVYMIDMLPVDLRGNDIIAVGVGALLISCIATLYPARMAASIVPTEGLKRDD
jgi:lipoprotein-releasing system permease protein